MSEKSTCKKIDYYAIDYELHLNIKRDPKNLEVRVTTKAEEELLKSTGKKIIVEIYCEEEEEK